MLRSSFVALTFIATINGMLTASPPSTAAYQPSQLGCLAKELAPSLQLLLVLDQLTTVNGPITSIPGKREPLQTSFVLTRPYTNVVETGYVTNEILGIEVPGRRIEATIRVNCSVNCWLDLSEVQVGRDPEFPATVEVKLPAPRRIEAEFSQGEKASFDVEYDRLRVQWLNKEPAKDLRRTLYKKALEQARAQFAKDWSSERATLASEVQTALRKMFPGRQIIVRWE